MFNGQSNTFYRISDVNKTSNLSACAINCDGVVVGYLSTEPIQYSSIVTIHINSIYQNLAHLGLLSTNAPNNALMKLSNLQPKVLMEVEECDIIQTLCHMIDTSRIVRMNNFNRRAFTLFNMIAVEFCLAVAFRNQWAFNSSIAVYSHSPNMHHVTFFVVFHDRDQNIFGWLSVICVGVVDSLNALHGIRSSTLFS